MDQYFDKVLQYLIELDCDIVQVDSEESLFVVNKEESGIFNLIIDCEDPILVFEQHIFDVPQDSMALYKRLLKINREIVHGALALDETGTKVIFRDTLQLENLDLNELQATLNALELLFVEFGEEIIEMSK